MNATLVHVGNIAVDFHLARAWNEFDCLGLQPKCAGRVCAAGDMLPARPWHTSAARWPVEESLASSSRSMITSDGWCLSRRAHAMHACNACMHAHAR